MATAKVTLRGRFPAGTIVRLVEVDGEHVLRAEGGREVDTKKVDKDGEVTFSSGVKDGGRYFAVGNVNGFPLEVRLRGRTGDDDAINSQAPIGPDRQRLADGSWLDEPPEKRDAPKYEAAPHLAVEQARGEILRSDTPRGSAHPLDPSEQAPKPRQEDVKKGTVQMSDTESGEATPIEVGPQRQEDVPKGTWQRSDTPSGVATPLPTGGPVEAQKEKESSDAKVKRGEPGKAAAAPLGKAKPVKGATEKASEKRDAELKESESDLPVVPGEGDGLDAQGQPVADDVAKSAGVEPAKKPAEPIRARKSAKKGK